MKEQDMNDNERSPRSADQVIHEEVEALQEAFSGLFRVGRLWAQHGLRVAELALQTSAETLRVTAETMGQGASRLGDDVRDAE